MMKELSWEEMTRFNYVLRCPKENCSSVKEMVQLYVTNRTRGLPDMQRMEPQLV